jgi:cell division protein ZapA
MKTISIKVSVADRPYRIKALPHESDRIKQAAQHIQEQMRQMRNEYGVTDKQDALAMTALLLSTELIESQETNQQLSNHQKHQQDEEILMEKLNQLDDILSNFLQKT